eukprot:TRINITY_DN10585_c0_g1_i1.p2 TRINITY_DN10585_c0_g1~~TRINITY_DN10585_c0_g1_i1.p2  ORF type:complete len:117 (+),score=20.39 TRINITY_DN10585_c0_g1_i1:204-554(+)
MEARRQMAKADEDREKASRLLAMQSLPTPASKCWRLFQTIFLTLTPPLSRSSFSFFSRALSTISLSLISKLLPLSTHFSRFSSSQLSSPVGFLLSVMMNPVCGMLLPIAIMDLLAI